MRRPPRRLAARAIGRRSSSSSRPARASTRPRRAATAADDADARSVAAAPFRLGGLQATAAGIPLDDGRGLGLGSSGRRRPCRGQTLLYGRPTGGSIVRGGAFLRGSPFRVGEPSARRLGLGLARCLGPAEGGEGLATGLGGRAQRRQLGLGLGEVSIGFRDRRLEVEVAGRDRSGQAAPGTGCLGLRHGPLVSQSLPVSTDRFEVGAEPTVPQLQLGEGRPGRVVGGAAFPLRRRPRGQLAGEGTGRGLGQLQLVHRGVGGRLGPVAPLSGGSDPGRSLVPAAVGDREQRRGPARRRRASGSPAAPPGRPTGGPAAAARRGCRRPVRGSPRTR